MTEHPQPNVNVTWGPDDASGPRTFPCPTCAARLDLRRSRKNKPYCVCNGCGIQLFFRGKAGIARLREFLNHERPAKGPSAAAVASLIAFGRLEQLRAQKEELRAKRPLFSTDKPLENAIAAVEHEMAHVQRRLEALSRRTKKLERSK